MELLFVSICLWVQTQEDLCLGVVVGDLVLKQFVLVAAQRPLNATWIFLYIVEYLLNVLGSSCHPEGMEKWRFWPHGECKSNAHSLYSLLVATKPTVTLTSSVCSHWIYHSCTAAACCGCKQHWQSAVRPWGQKTKTIRWKMLTCPSEMERAVTYWAYLLVHQNECLHSHCMLFFDPLFT